MCAYGEFILNEIRFYSDDPKKIKEMAQNALKNTDKHDPSSIYYERNLVRPKISWIHIFFNISATILSFILIARLLYILKNELLFSIIVTSISLLLFLLLNLKKIFICIIQIYQHYAPTSIRMKCRFEPSCSQYMILSIEKYGAIKGLRIGIKRLRRCKVGNGGYDYP